MPVRSETRVQGEGTKMNLKIVPHLRVLIGGVALILLSIAGIATVIAWVPNAGEMETLGVALDSLPPPGRPVGVDEQISAGQARRALSARRQCEECGVVASTREIRQHSEGSEFAAAGDVTRGGRSGLPDASTRTYEVTVRMQDGSNRVFVQASPANWRVGERLIFIAGLTQAGN